MLVRSMSSTEDESYSAAQRADFRKVNTDHKSAQDAIFTNVQKGVGVGDGGVMGGKRIDFCNKQIGYFSDTEKYFPRASW